MSLFLDSVKPTFSFTFSHQVRETNRAWAVLWRGGAPTSFGFKQLKLKSAPVSSAGRQQVEEKGFHVQPAAAAANHNEKKQLTFASPNEPLLF